MITWWLATLLCAGIAVVSCGVDGEPSSAPVSAASAITFPPAVLEGINSEHASLQREDSAVRFGTHADPRMITLGPQEAGPPDYPPYPGKNSANVNMPLNTPVLAPLDMRFVGFANRSAKYREEPDGTRLAPFDDLETCFVSEDPAWPGLVFCAYHLSTSPLLLGHGVDPNCSSVERWDPDSPGQAYGRLFFEDNDALYEPDGTSGPGARDARPCRGLVGRSVKRGEVIGYSGRVGDNPHVGLRFKVRHATTNPLVRRGDSHLHWVQPAAFFFWRCYSQNAEFQPGVLAYPFACGGHEVPSELRSPGFKYQERF